MKRRFLFLASAGALGMLAGPALAAGAPAYPQKPITIVVAFAPGGLTDTLARRFAKDLQAEFDQTVLVETKAGASGQIASAQVARASPDGYTLLVTATHHVINPAITPTLPYDTEKDFIPIAELGSTPNVLLVHPSLPVTNLQEYLSYARKQPGGLAYATSGVAGSTHLSGEMLALMTKVPLLHVAYKGVAPASTDLLGGQVPSLFGDLQSMMPLIKDGRVRAIGVSSAQRSPSVPDVPTIAEQGVPGFEGTSFIGLYGPSGLPPSVVDTLNRVALKSMNSEETLELLRTNGGSSGKKSAAEFKSFIDQEMAKWRKVVKEGNVKAQ